jgi:iron complex outermembrane recepter protein
MDPPPGPGSRARYEPEESRITMVREEVGARSGLLPGRSTLSSTMASDNTYHKHVAFCPRPERNVRALSLNRMAALALPVALATSAVAVQPVAAQVPSGIVATVRHATTGAPVAGATVRARPGGASCVTAGDGRCRLALVSGMAEVSTTADGFAPDTQSLQLVAGALLPVTFELEPSALRLPEIVAVGARAAERAAAGSPVPADVISSQRLVNTGLTETWEQLQRLVPSVHVPHIPIGDNHARPITLRGLAPHHALVLVNGKRRHAAPVLLAGPAVPATGYADLNAIPASAIERIEILRDGASAQYGSDAIGGVVNLVLKTGSRREGWAAAGSVLSTEGGRSFRDGRQLGAGGTVGVVRASGVHATLTGEFRDREGTNRAYPDVRPQYFAGDPRNDRPPRISSYLGNGAVRSLSAWLDAGMPLGGDIEAYVSGGAADRDGTSPDAFFRLPMNNNTVRAIHPDGFLPEIHSGMTDVSALAGLRGAMRGWRWNVSSGWGGSRVAYTVRNSNNPSLGAQSPTTFDVGRVSAGQWTTNLDVTRDVRAAPVPLSIAAGAEFRVDRYALRAGEPDSWRDGQVPILDGPAAGRPASVGSEGMIGFRPVDEVSARRSSTAGYLEAEGRPVARLLLQTALRTEHHSDFGSTTAGKVAARVDLPYGLAARGSLGTGFRAPALAQQHFSSTRTVYRLVGGTNTVLTVRTFPVHTAEAQLLGATPLRPEESVNRNAGVVLDLPRWPLIAVDVYQVDITDRIALRGSVTDTSLTRLFEENGMRGIGGGNYFANAWDTRTRGVDVAASHAFVLRNGVLRLHAGYNHNRSVITRRATLPPPLARFEPQLYNRTGQGVIEEGQPRETIALTVNYATGHWGVNLHNRRAGPTAQLDQTDPAADQVVQAHWITDARVSYRVHPRLQLALSAANLFDVYPDEWWDFRQGLEVNGPSMKGIFRYPGGLSPFGMNGRTVNVQLAWQ